MSILALPTEIIENILIAAAAGGFPHAIAAFSQTCRACYEVVYKQKDHHLWREIFLTEFDDPRASGGGPGWGECISSRAPHEEFNWTEQFHIRTWAANYLRRHTNPSDISYGEYTLEDVISNGTRAFEIVLSVIKTSLPCPPTIVFSFLPSVQTGAPPTPHTTYPSFPPLPPALAGLAHIDSANATGHTLEKVNRARNTEWLESVLSMGLPPRVASLFSADKWQGGLAGQHLPLNEFREMQAAGHLVACTGFIPVAPRAPDAPPLPTPMDPSERFADSLLGENAPVSGPEYAKPENQLKRARRLARMRVYNMRYLSRDRHWGPFLQVVPKGKPPPPRAPDDDDLLQPILALFRTAPVEQAHMDDGDSNDDGEEDEDEEEEDADIAEDGDEEHDHEHADADEGGGRRGGGDEDASDDELGPAQLNPDWAYLAAVRVVVEANLRESAEDESLRGLFALDGLRPGSAPWDCAAYKQTAAAEPPASCAKGKGREDAEVAGWDWAGVTGMWKRCVCWMDYRDLILHNLSGEFEDPHLAEAVRIISMRLRVHSYSPSRVPGYAHLPTIHVEGDTAGSMPGNPRRMEGTVSVIADGSVRWTLYSSVEGSDTYEWVSEGVQIGGVASAMGILGMWTGAQHERMDPLGPTWAWKVG